jgi:hypothetical protein
MRDDEEQAVLSTMTFFSKNIFYRKKQSMVGNSYCYLHQENRHDDVVLG